MSLPPEDGAFDTDNTKTESETRSDLENTLQSLKEMLGGESEPSGGLAISAGSITPTRAKHDIVAESGGVDDLTLITTTNHPSGRLLLLRAFAGEVITVIHNGSNIDLHRDEDFVMQGDQGVLFEVVGSNQVREIQRFGREPSQVADVDVLFAGNWVGGAFAMRWYKDNDGVVHVIGFAANATDPDSGSTIITMPVGYRPPSTIYAVAPDDATDFVHFVVMGTSGNLNFQRTTGFGTTDEGVVLGLNFSYPTTLL